MGIDELKVFVLLIKSLSVILFFYSGVFHMKLPQHLLRSVFFIYVMLTCWAILYDSEIGVLRLAGKRIPEVWEFSTLFTSLTLRVCLFLMNSPLPDKCNKFT